MYRYLPNILTSYSTHMQHSPRVIFSVSFGAVLALSAAVAGDGSLLLYFVYTYIWSWVSLTAVANVYHKYYYIRVYRTHTCTLLFHCWTHRYERERNKEIMLKLHYIIHYIHGRHPCRVRSVSTCLSLRIFRVNSNALVYRLGLTDLDQLFLRGKILIRL